jgi:hypothetical protein
MELVPGAELIPECSTSRNRMYSRNNYKHMCSYLIESKQKRQISYNFDTMHDERKEKKNTIEEMKKVLLSKSRCVIK